MDAGGGQRLTQAWAEFTKRAVLDEIALEDALADALEDWVAASVATAEWRATDEGGDECRPIVLGEDGQARRAVWGPAPGVRNRPDAPDRA